MRKLLLLIILAVGLFVYHLIRDAGVFVQIKNSFKGGKIVIYDQAIGTEDMDVLYESGLIFISSADRRTHEDDGGISGQIYLLKADSCDYPRVIPHTPLEFFNPHGISLYREAGNTYLFVVNHRLTGNFIERFKYASDSLIHEKSFNDDIMFSPNDIVAIGRNEFYVTNDHGFYKGFKRKLEDYLRLPKSYLIHYKETAWQVVYKGLNYANGINVSNDGKILYATQTIGQSLMRYNIMKDGNLSLIDELKLNSGLDNIDVDQNGDLWIGAHPKLFDFVNHSKNERFYSPSQVIRVKYDIDGIPTSEVIFLDDGELLSGSSVAVTYKKTLFVGVVFDNKILKAELN